jgi:hypothetical protein
MVKKNLSISPDRHRFQLERYLERQAEEGKSPDNDDDVQAMVEYMEKTVREHQDPNRFAGQETNNLEYDLLTTDWILSKVRDSDAYAQNLYAAMCNRSFQRNDVMPILKNQTWSCSWRYAGGIIADMRESGDYIDWYCSGISDKDDPSGYVGEGTVTDEIRADLLELGWIVIDDNQ